MKNEERIRLWELVELLQDELSRPQPDWGHVRAAAQEFHELVERAA